MLWTWKFKSSVTRDASVQFLCWYWQKSSIYINRGTNHTRAVVLFVFTKMAENRTRKKQRYRSFGLYLRNSAINLPSFWYGNSHYSILWGNYTPYAEKILKWAIINLIWSKFGHFWPKSSILSLFGLYFQKSAINFPNFCYRNCSYRLLWENRTPYAGKTLKL